MSDVKRMSEEAFRKSWAMKNVPTERIDSWIAAMKEGHAMYSPGRKGCLVHLEGVEAKVRP